ncbi:MAG TPA: di-trans,poly-cis-decaprenylcistransferase [Bryobacteraceae bacterium]|nr:di-trans,poly-cis-decaprenylcistransferase [Bryobacteraceae bacterium]
MAQYFASQSTLHVGIIMDGNGRWAIARGLPRAAGHRAGVETVGRVVEAAPQAGIGILTLFAFSSDNWRRPPAEVEALMRLLSIYMAKETPRCVEQGVRLEVIGRRDRLAPSLCTAISRVEAATARGSRLRLRIAVDYSARDAILAAARGVAELSLDALGSALGPPVDLLIRTGGERRLSDFLLWECAYAELVFSRTMWPDFGAQDLFAAVREFRGRERRFGAVPEAPVRLSEAWLD